MIKIYELAALAGLVSSTGLWGEADCTAVLKDQVDYMLDFHGNRLQVTMTSVDNTSIVQQATYATGVLDRASPPVLRSGGSGWVDQREPRSTGPAQNGEITGYFSDRTFCEYPRGFACGFSGPFDSRQTDRLSIQLTNPSLAWFDAGSKTGSITVWNLSQGGTPVKFTTDEMSCSAEGVFSVVKGGVTTSFAFYKTRIPR